MVGGYPEHSSSLPHTTKRISSGTNNADRPATYAKAATSQTQRTATSHNSSRPLSTDSLKRYSLTLKHNGTTPKPAREEVFKLLSRETLTRLTNLAPKRTGFDAFVADLRDIESLLSRSSATALSKLNLTALKPRYFDDSLTLLVRKVPSFVGEHTENELLEELSHCSQASLRKVVKFPYSISLVFFPLRG